jgi:4'-phosphopantetheinyl transferase
MINITAITLSELRASGITSGELLKYLPETSKTILAGKSNTDNRDRSLLGELLARYSVNRFAGIENTEIEFSIADKGKPHLMDLPGVHFNISHSGDVVVCAVAGSDIGIDVEHYRKVNFRVAERFFSPMELSDLLSLEESEKQEYFFTLWTIKESFLKAIGSGLTRTLNSFTVVRKEEGFSLTGDVSAESFSVKTYNLPGNYHLAVCCTEPFFPAGVQMLTTIEIMRSLAYLE